MVVVKAGLGREAANLQLAFNPTHRSGGFVAAEPPAGHAVKPIKILQGDAYIADALGNDPVNFIKIDVEGFELEVLMGLRETIAKNRPVVTLEMNHWCLNAFQRTSIPDFLDALCQIFPLLYAVGNGQAEDLRDPGARYHVTYRHIVHFEYMALVAAFDEGSLDAFLNRYVRNRSAVVPASEPQAADVALGSTMPSPNFQSRVARMADLRGDSRKLEAALLAVREKVERLAAVSVLFEQRRELVLHLAAMQNSSSWKATAPLRATKTWLRSMAARR